MHSSDHGGGKDYLFRSSRAQIARTLLVCSLGGLAACSGGGGGSAGAGGGGGGSGGGGGGSGTGSLAPKDSFDEADAMHLLQRTHFGVRRQELDRLAAIGLAAYVDEMLEFPTMGSTQAELDAFQQLVNDDDPDGFEGRFPSHSDLVRWWLHLMMHTEHPFQEELAFFWHEHFATSSYALNSHERYWMHDQIEMFRAQGAGNMRELLIAVTRDPAMAKWLDQTNNDQFNINENYAREFWELFSLGVDNGYTPTDIRESAESHTGANIVYDPESNLSNVVFVPEDHADGTKSVLGSLVGAQHGAGADEHDDVVAIVDITLGYTGPDGGVAEFLCRKLLAHYVMPHPSETLVSEMADLLRDSDYELQPVLAALFKSTAFHSDSAKEGIVKGPVEACVGLIRSTGLFVPEYTLDYSLQKSAQSPTQPPNVNGWEEGEELLSSMAMLEMANLAADVIEARTYQEDELGIEMSDLLPPSGPLFAEDVIDYWANLLGVELDNAETAILVGYMDSVRASDGKITASLFTAANDEHLDERLRGLLYILAQHPTYLLR